MKTLLVLALALVGCGDRALPVDGTTDWTVTLGSTQAPTCRGAMRLAPNAQVEPHGQPPAFVGTWSCGSYGRQASGDIRPDGQVFLNLETTPGFLNGVRATITDDVITGEILIADQLVPFMAYRQ